MSRLVVWSKWRALMLVLVGMLIGMLLVGVGSLVDTADAHVGSPSHLWREHIRPRVKKLGDQRWVKPGELSGALTASAARVGFCGSDNAPDADYECFIELYAPQPGVVVLNGSAETWLPTAAGDRERTVSCWFKVGSDGTPMAGTVRDVQLDLDDDQEENCSTNGGTPVQAGWHRFYFMLNIEEGVQTFDVGANLVYSPYSGTG